jgi:AhpD family alkylhydroperoxidase
MEASGKLASNRGVISFGLVTLGGVVLAIGLWVLIDPRSFFDNFPGWGLEWASPYGPYNEHLLLDAGALFVGLGVLLLLAATWCETRLVRAALVTYLVFQVPHLIFHLNSDHVLSPGESLASESIIAGSVALAAALLALTYVRRPFRRTLTAASQGSTRLDPRRTGLLTWLIDIYAARRFGAAVTPAKVLAHHPRVLLGYGAFDLMLESSHTVDARLKGLAELRASTLVGCEWCIDFGSDVVRRRGVSDDQLRELPRYRDSDAFDELEKLVLDFATAMTRTPPTVDDDLFGRLRMHFDEAQLVELTVAIAAESLHGRVNDAMGFAAEGFSAGSTCALPDRDSGAR